MEEPKKLLTAQYHGSIEVPQPTGMDILNAAIDAALLVDTPEHWKHVQVAVAPSMISICSDVSIVTIVCWLTIDKQQKQNNNKQTNDLIIVAQNDGLVAECRVRYLSFLGIGHNTKNCAFIMHTADDKFVCHTFTCHPSSSALCKTIEAACKVVLSGNLKQSSFYSECYTRC